MKRENRVKKIVAMMLALVLSVCQIPVISYAEDDAEQNGFIAGCKGKRSRSQSLRI